MSTITGFNAWQIYKSVNLHFKRDSYDYFKYNGKNNSNKNYSSYNKLGTKFIFENLSHQFTTKEEFIGFYLSNILEQKTFITEYNKEIYLTWLGRIQALEHKFQEDIKDIKKFVAENGLKFNDVFIVKDKAFPELFSMLLQDKICIESFIILQKILNFFPVFDDRIDEDILWPMWRRMCIKYYPFLEIDIKKYKRIAKQAI